MRRTLTAFLLALSFCTASWAQTPADRAAIQRVITAQIEAFRHDDAQAAYSLAAPAIQAKFGDAAHFLAMVREAYPVVFRPSAISFGTLAPTEGGLLQKVELTAQDGKPALAIYDMVQQPPGTWRIAGCILAPSERLDI